MVLRIGTDRPETLRGTRVGDTLDGRGGADRLFGLAGDDLLFGGPGVNRIDGGPGRDAVGFGFDEEDFVVFGAAQVTDVDLAAGTYAVGGVVTRLAGVEGAFGGGQGDTLLGDDGANRIRGLEGDDVISGRGGDDVLLGGEGRNTISGGAGRDTIDAVTPGTEEADEVRAGPGDDLLRLSQGDTARGDAGADQFQVGVSYFFSGRVERLFTARDFDPGGGDVIGLPSYPGFRGDDPATQPYVFVGGGRLAANDTPEVRAERRGGDTFVQFEVQDDPESGQEVNEVRLTGLVALSADDFLLGFETTAGDDTITGTPFADRVSAAAGDDRVSGRAGGDDLEGGPGDDRLSGGDGDDRLSGGTGDDTYDGGPGDDRLSDAPGGSEESDDTYLFSGRFGQDRLDDFSGGSNRAVFRGLDRADVDLFRDSTDLVVTVKDTGDSVAITSFFSDAFDLDLVFRDGTLSPEALA